MLCSLHGLHHQPGAKAAPRPGAGVRPPSSLTSVQIHKTCCAGGMLLMHHSSAWLLPGNLWPDVVCTRCSQINAFAERSATPLLETAHSCSYLLLLKTCSTFMFVFVLKRQQQNQSNKKSSLMPKQFYVLTSKQLWKRGEVHLSGRVVVHFPEKGIK